MKLPGKVRNHFARDGAAPVAAATSGDGARSEGAIRQLLMLVAMFQ